MIDWLNASKEVKSQRKEAQRKNHATASGPMVTFEGRNVVMGIHQCKAKGTHEEWHVVPLPVSLEEPRINGDSKPETSPASAGVRAQHTSSHASASGGHLVTLSHAAASIVHAVRLFEKHTDIDMLDKIPQVSHL